MNDSLIDFGKQCLLHKSHVEDTYIDCKQLLGKGQIKIPVCPRLKYSIDKECEDNSGFPIEKELESGSLAGQCFDKGDFAQSVGVSLLACEIMSRKFIRYQHEADYCDYVIRHLSNTITSIRCVGPAEVPPQYFLLIAKEGIIPILQSQSRVCGVSMSSLTNLCLNIGAFFSTYEEPSLAANWVFFADQIFRWTYESEQNTEKNRAIKGRLPIHKLRKAVNASIKDKKVDNLEELFDEAKRDSSLHSFSKASIDLAQAVQRLSTIDEHSSDKQKHDCVEILEQHVKTILESGVFDTKIGGMLPAGFSVSSGIETLFKQGDMLLSTGYANAVSDVKATVGPVLNWIKERNFTNIGDHQSEVWVQELRDREVIVPRKYHLTPELFGVADQIGVLIQQECERRLKKLRFQNFPVLYNLDKQSHHLVDEKDERELSVDEIYLRLRKFEGWPIPDKEDLESTENFCRFYAKAVEKLLCEKVFEAIRCPEVSSSDSELLLRHLCDVGHLDDPDHTNIDIFDTLKDLVNNPNSSMKVPVRLLWSTCMVADRWYLHAYYALKYIIYQNSQKGSSTLQAKRVSQLDGLLEFARLLVMLADHKHRERSIWKKKFDVNTFKTRAQFEEHIERTSLIYIIDAWLLNQRWKGDSFESLITTWPYKSLLYRRCAFSELKRFQISHIHHLLSKYVTFHQKLKKGVEPKRLGYEKVRKGLRRSFFPDNI